MEITNKEILPVVYQLAEAKVFINDQKMMTRTIVIKKYKSKLTFAFEANKPISKIILKNV